MAGLQQKGLKFYCQFRYQGKRYTLSLGNLSRVAAEARAGAVDHLLYKLKRGYVTIPSGISTLDFFIHDGNPPATVSLDKVAHPPCDFGMMRDSYLAAVQSLEQTTITTLRVHFRHLTKTYGDRHPFEFSLPTLQRHIARRSNETTNSGKKIDSTTIRKELVTLRSCHHWAAESGYVHTSWPKLKALRFSKQAEKLPWMTWEECERIGTNDAWESLFLRPNEVTALLQHVSIRAIQP